MLKSIKTKILMTQFSLVLFIVLVLGFFGYSLLKGYLKTVQKGKLEFIARHKADMIQSYFSEKKALMKRMSEGSEIKLYRRKYQDIPLLEYFTKFKEEFPVLSFVNEEGLEGVKIVNGEMSEGLRDISETVIFQDTIREHNKPVISPLEYNPELGAPAINLAIAKYTYFGDEFIGMLLGTIPLSEITKDISRLEVGESGFGSLIDKQGNILAYPREDKILNKITGRGKEAKELISNAMALKNGFARVTILGLDGFVAYAPVKDMGWSVMVTLPYDEFISLPNKLRNTFFAGTFVILVVSGLLNLKITGSLTKPILKLNLAAKALAEGNFSQKADIKSKDEVGALAESFNYMSDNLNQLIQKEREFTEDYRKKTEELEKAYAELEKSEDAALNIMEDLDEQRKELQREITERKNAEEKVKASEEKTRLLLESTAEAIYGLDLKGNCTFCNPSCIRILGYRDQQDLLGKNMHNLIHHTHPDGTSYKMTECKIYQAFREGKGTHVNDEVLWRSDGTSFPTEYWSYPVFREGIIIGSVVTFVNITERKKVEEVLAQRAQELTRLNAELEQFAYVASHDLQEPLRMVTSYVQLLEKRYKDKLDTDAKEFIGFAVDGSRRMQGLINALLALSRVGTHGRPFELIDCESILNLAIINLQVAIKETKAAVTHDSLPKVMADDIQLVQLFQNLIGNAIKFRGKDLPRIHLSAKKEKDYWVFSVHDNGIGIEQKYKDKIFKIFQRVHSKDEYPGAGIGLSVCRKIVERHGGQIWVKSEPGKGSTFYFTIPIKGVRSNR